MSDLLANAVIQQFNLGFDPLQDRLLLKLGLADDTEITVWLTRRVVKALWGMLQGASMAPLLASDALETQKALENFEREARNSHVGVQKMDFSESYQTNRIARTLEPLLPGECRILSEDNIPSALEMESKDGNRLSIPLSAEIMQALINMLQLATREAGWDLNLVASMTVVNTPANQAILH